MRTILLAVALALVAPFARAQFDCDQIVSDQTYTFSDAQKTQVKNAAEALINSGTDVREVVLGQTGNIDLTVSDLRARCLSWQSPNRGMKSSLIVVAVSPVSHKAGIYYGSAIAPALDAHWRRINTDYGLAHYRTGDIAGGMTAVTEQLTKRLVAAKDETLHPAVSTVTNQATDFSGLWHFLGWCLLIGTIVLLLYALYAWYERRRREREEQEAAQQRAIIARSSAAHMVNQHRDDAATNSRIGHAIDTFTELNNSERTNPDTPGLTADSYNNIAEQYYYVTNEIVHARLSDPEDPTPEPTGSPEPTTEEQPTRTRAAAAGASGPNTVPTVLAAEPATSIFAPVVVNEPTFYEPEPTHATRSDDDGGGGSSYTSSSSDDGGSSSWSDSSSSSDGGGSADFGGGGGDGGGSGGW